MPLGGGYKKPPLLFPENSLKSPGNNATTAERGHKSLKFGCCGIVLFERVKQIYGKYLKNQYVPDKNFSYYPCSGN